MPATEPNWEPLPNVIASVETAGYTMSKSQLWRLTSAGIVGEPKVESRGRSLGKESHYPPGTAERTIRALSLADVERRLPERAWLIWWLDGGEMSTGARTFLQETARELDHQLGQIRKLVKGNALGDPDAVAQLKRSTSEHRPSASMARSLRRANASASRAHRRSCSSSSS